MPGFILSNVTHEKDSFPIKREDYYVHAIEETKDYNLRTFIYDGYPTKLDQINNNEWIYQEGIIYDSAVDIRDIAQCINNGNKEELGIKIKEIDGDFVIIHYNQSTGLITILNDNLGKLPVYIYRGEFEEIIITREIEYLHKSNLTLSTNRNSAAIQLLFGHHFGVSTCWNEIEKMAPNSCVQININSKSIEQTDFFEMNFNFSNHIKEKLVEEISLELKNSIERRISKTLTPSISLSGGLDSRLIAGYSNELQLKTPYTTYLVNDFQNSIDVSSAKEIRTKTGGINDHHFYKIEEPSFDDKNELFNIKRGLNPINMSLLVSYLKWLKEKDLSTITGDGGDYFISDISSLTKIYTKRQLIKYLIKFRGISSLKTVSSITGLREEKIFQIVEKQIDSYPVSSIKEKHAYFLCKERYINWNIEGEDRNRFFTWSTSPYNSPKLIKLSLEYPMHKKNMDCFF